MLCSEGSCIVAQVSLGGGVGVDVSAPVAAKILANFWMTSMVWTPEGAKSAAGEGLDRELTRRLAVSVAVSAENIAVMEP